MFFARKVVRNISTRNSKCLFCGKTIKTGEERVEVLNKKSVIVAVFCSDECQREKEAILMEKYSKERGL